MKTPLLNRPSPRPSNILVVDDQLSNLKFMSAVLRTNGHRVLQAHSGETALEILRLDRIELLVMDVHMPHLNGIALVTRAREIKPDIKVVIVSGGIDKAERREIDALQVTGFLQKPFTAAELMFCVNGILRVPEAHYGARHKARRVAPSLQAERIAS